MNVKNQSKYTWSTVSQFAGFITIISGLGNYFVKEYETEYLFWMLGTGIFLVTLPFLIRYLRRIRSSK